MNKKNKIIIVIFIILGIISFAFFFTKRNGRENRLEAEGNQLIKKIEHYRADNGKLPNSLSEMGIEETESGPLYYEKKDSINYVVWFGTSLGESKTYRSESKEWK